MEILQPGTLRLEHFSAEPIGRLDPLWDRYSRYGGAKPPGLWVSVAGEYSWDQWCHAEEFRLERLLVRIPVELNPGANILHVEGEASFAKLVTIYGYNPYPTLGGYRDRQPDWDKMKDDYDGIVISPYLWSQRLDAMWYYGWDCASGCIWNLKSISLGEPVIDKTRCYKSLDNESELSHI